MRRSTLRLLGLRSGCWGFGSLCDCRLGRRGGIPVKRAHSVSSDRSTTIRADLLTDLVVLQTISQLIWSEKVKQRIG